MHKEKLWEYSDSQKDLSTRNRVKCTEATERSVIYRRRSKLFFAVVFSMLLFWPDSATVCRQQSSTLSYTCTTRMSRMAIHEYILCWMAKLEGSEKGVYAQEFFPWPFILSNAVSYSTWTPCFPIFTHFLISVLHLYRLRSRSGPCTCGKN